MAFSPDGATLLVNDSNSEIQLWSVSQQSAFMCFHCGESRFEILSFSPDGANLTTLDEDGILQVWNMPSGDLLHTFDKHPGAVGALAFSPDGNFLAAGSSPSVGTWRTSDSMLLSISIHKSYYSRQQTLVFSPDSKLLAFGPYGGGLRLIEIANANPILVLNDGQTVYDMAFSPDGTTLAVSFGIDQTIEFRRVLDGTLLDTLVLSGFGGVNHIVYSPDGNFLAIARYEGVEIWDLSNRTLVHSLRGIGYFVAQVVFLPNGNILATGQTTVEWSGTSRELLQSMRIRGDVFSPDTNLLITRQSEKIHFFRVSDGKLIRTLRLNTQILDVEFSTDGKLMALAADDGTVRIWGISSEIKQDR